MKKLRIPTVWSLLPGVLLFGAALTVHRPAKAVPAFAQQTGRSCAACHVGGFGPELTQFGREFKLGGYTLRLHGSVPLSAMAVASWTQTNKNQVPPPEHLSRNDNLVLDQASLFVAGGMATISAALPSSSPMTELGGPGHGTISTCAPSPTPSCSERIQSSA